MKSKTRNRIDASVPDFEEVRALGYEVYRFQPWHYRISHPDYETRVDVWPTTRKLWKVDSGHTATYELGDLGMKVAKIFAQEYLEESLRPRF